MSFQSTTPSTLIYDEESFIPGEFNYIKNQNHKIMLETAWKAVTVLDLWDFMKQDIETYAFSMDPRVNQISNKIEEFGYIGHSGMSFGFIMRDMQFIAKYGEEEYRKKIL